MKPRSLGATLPAALTILAVPGCVASSRLLDSWKDPEYSGPPLRNVVVLGLSRDVSRRRTFEDVFVGELRKEAVEASPSSATSETIDPSSVEGTSRELTGLVVEELAKPD